LKREDVQVELEERNPDIQHTGAVFAPDGDAAIDDGHLDAFRLAGCPCCGSEKLKPDVVFFGEGVPNQIAQAAWAKVRNAKALMVVGSSLMAYSSFRLCKLTVEHGKPLVAINLGKTRADAILNMKIEQHSEDILPRLAAKFGSNN
jgi:NAD-dependent SIR2 family protein deacetylase